MLQDLSHASPLSTIAAYHQQQIFNSANASFESPPDRVRFEDHHVASWLASHRSRTLAPESGLTLVTEFGAGPSRAALYVCATTQLDPREMV